MTRLDRKHLQMRSTHLCYPSRSIVARASFSPIQLPVSNTLWTTPPRTLPDRWCARLPLKHWELKKVSSSRHPCPVKLRSLVSKLEAWRPLSLWKWWRAIWTNICNNQQEVQLLQGLMPASLICSRPSQNNQLPWRTNNWQDASNLNTVLDPHNKTLVIESTQIQAWEKHQKRTNRLWWSNLWSISTRSVPKKLPRRLE